MATRRPKFYQRKYIVWPRFQFELIAFFSIGSAAILLTIYMNMRGIMKVFAERCAVNDRIATAVCLDFVSGQLHAIHSLFISCALAFFTFLILGLVVVSHRIAGPLYRIVTNIRLIAQGVSVPPIKVRKNDYFKEVADAVNEILQANSK